MPFVCGFRFPVGLPAVSIASIEEAVQVASAGGTAWLHLNRADTRARRWIEQASVLPREFAAWVDEPDSLDRFERRGEALFARFEDFVFADRPDATEVSPLWVCIMPGLLVTVRSRALQSTDRLREAARGGLVAGSGMVLFTHLLAFQAGFVEKMRRSMGAQVDRAEDAVLTDRLSMHRGALGGVRRTCAHLRRHFAPQRVAIRRLVLTEVESLAAGEREALSRVAETLGQEIDEAGALYERAKLLQEELAARLAEETNRILFLLTTISAVFMPMTLVTGIWGMNVAGLPGTQEESAFWWVLALIGVTGFSTVAYLLALRRRQAG